MKNFLNSTGNLLVLILCFTVVTIYFGIMTIFNITSVSKLDNKDTSVAMYAQNNTESVSLSDEEYKLIEEYEELKGQLEKTQKSAREYLNQNKEIDNFIINQYGEAIQNEYDDFKTYKEKQKAMKSKMAPLFSDEAFRKTMYYDLTTDSEEYTKKITTFGSERIITYKNKIVYKRNIFRAFYKNIKSDSGEVFLEIYNNNVDQNEYEKLKVEKDEEGNFRITDYEIIRQY